MSEFTTACLVSDIAPQSAKRVFIDGTAIADKGLKLPAGRYVLQVGKRKFARVTLLP